MRRIVHRMAQLGVYGFCLVSLLASLATGLLWWRSYRRPAGAEDHASRFLPAQQARYTVRSQRGRLTLYAPPPLLPVAAPVPPPPWVGTGLLPEEAAERAVGRIADDQLEWHVTRVRETNQEPHVRPNENPRTRRGTPAHTLWISLAAASLAQSQPGSLVRIAAGDRLEMTRQPPAAALAQWRQAAQARQARVNHLQIPLLRALEDPDRFLAAHVALQDWAAAAGRAVPMNASKDWPHPQPGGSFVQTVDGLPVRLRPERPASPDAGSGSDAESWACTARIDPAQMAAVRDLWHRRLDVPVRSMAHWKVLLAAAFPPLLALIVRGRRSWVRRRRGHRGLCLRCGYDLRGCRESGRCSECGEPIVAAGTATAPVVQEPAGVAGA